MTITLDTTHPSPTHPGGPPPPQPPYPKAHYPDPPPPTPEPGPTRPGGVRTAAAILADIQARGGDVNEHAPSWHDPVWLEGVLGDPERLLSRRQVTDMTGIGERTLYDWSKRGLLCPADPTAVWGRRYRAADVLVAAMAVAGES